MNARFRHIAAEFVWLVPAGILTYKIATYPVVSVLDSYSYSAAFHHYFAGGFQIPEYRDWQELWSIAALPDVIRGTAQLEFTAPFYAGIGYSAAAWIARRTDLNRKIVNAFNKWEEAKFEGEEARLDN